MNENKSSILFSLEEGKM